MSDAGKIPNYSRTGGTVIHKWNGYNLTHFQTLDEVQSVPAVPGAWNRFGESKQSPLELRRSNTASLSDPALLGPLI
jgi:hypothetical protein